MCGTMPGGRSLTQAKKTTHGLDGQHQYVKSQSEWQRTEINGESTSMVWPTVGSRTAKNIRTAAQLCEKNPLEKAFAIGE